MLGVGHKEAQTEFLEAYGFYYNPICKEVHSFFYFAFIKINKILLILDESGY